MSGIHQQPQGRVWRNGVLTSKQIRLDDLPTLVQDPSTLVWIDLLQPGVEELSTTASALGLPPSAVEEALGSHPRSRLARHDKYLFFTVFDATMDSDTRERGRLRTRGLSGIVTRNAVVTIRRDPSWSTVAFTRHWDEDADEISHGSAMLLYGILDSVADSHLAAIQELDDAIEELEDALFEDDRTPDGFQQQLYGIRKDLVELRYVVIPMREIVNGLLLRSEEHTSMTPWFDDLYFRALRAAEWADSLRDMVSSLFETNLSLQDARLNSIMKKLSGWAAVIAVPTAITGWFGQNIPFWGFSQPVGLWLSTALILVAMIVLYVVFRQRDWL